MKKGDGEIFYENIYKKIDEKLSGHYLKLFSEKEKNQFRSMYKSVNTPFYYAYFQGFEIMLKNIVTFFMALAIAMCACVATVFSNENHTKMDSIIYSTRYGRNKVFSSKIIASLIFSTALFVFGVTIFTLCHILTFGVSGWNVSLQMLFGTASYNFTLSQAYLFALALGYLSYIGVMMLSLLISSILKNNFISIIAVAILFMVPSFVSSNPFSRLFINALSATPIHMMNSVNQLAAYDLVPFFGFSIPIPYAAAIITLLAIIALYVITMIVYKKQQVTNS